MNLMQKRSRMVVLRGATLLIVIALALGALLAPGHVMADPAIPNACPDPSIPANQASFSNINSSSKHEAWDPSGGGSWTTSGFPSGAGEFTEGDSVPIRVTVNGTGCLTFVVCPDYDVSGEYPFLGLTPYNTSFTPTAPAPGDLVDNEPTTQIATPNAVAVESNSFGIVDGDLLYVQTGGVGGLGCDPDTSSYQVFFEVTGSDPVVVYGLRSSRPFDPLTYGAGPGYNNADGAVVGIGESSGNVNGNFQTVLASPAKSLQFSASAFTPAGIMRLQKISDIPLAGGFTFNNATPPDTIILNPTGTTPNLTDETEFAVDPNTTREYVETVPAGWTLANIICQYEDIIGNNISYTTGAVYNTSGQASFQAGDTSALVSIPPYYDTPGDNIVRCIYTNLSNTLVELASFTAEAEGDGATLYWETAAEIDNAGFNLYRSGAVDGERVQINDQLIAAAGDNAGASYAYSDADPGDGLHFYWLEDVDTAGESTLHGPVQVQVGEASTQFDIRLFLPLITSR